MALSLTSDAPPAVPKVSLHKDARSEVLHVWREWRHRQMLKQFKEAVSKSSEESVHRVYGKHCSYRHSDFY